MRPLVYIVTTGWLLLYLGCQSPSESFSPPLWTFRTHVPVGFIHPIDADKLGVKSADTYYILNKFDGQIMDQIPLGNVGLAGILYDNHRIYYGSSHNTFQCYDLEGREAIWTFQTGSENQATPVDDGQKVYWGSADSSVYAVDKQTGALQWKFTTGSHIYATPVWVDSLLLIGSWDTGLYAFHRETGKELWKFQAETAVTQKPLLFKQTVWLPCYDSHIYGIDRFRGELVFDFAADNAFEFGGVRWRDTLIFTGIDRNLYFVDPLGKAVTVKGKFPVAISTRPVIRDGILISGHYDGSLYLWDLLTMQKRLLYRFDERVLTVWVDERYLWASSWDRTTLCFALESITEQQM